MKGYKALLKINGVLKCRHIEFNVNELMFYKGKINLCSNGFHFCTELKDVFKYYDILLKNLVVYEIEASGNISEQETNCSKRVCSQIKLIREIPEVEYICEVDDKHFEMAVKKRKIKIDDILNNLSEPKALLLLKGDIYDSPLSKILTIEKYPHLYFKDDSFKYVNSEYKAIEWLKKNPKDYLKVVHLIEDFNKLCNEIVLDDDMKLDICKRNINSRLKLYFKVPLAEVVKQIENENDICYILNHRFTLNNNQKLIIRNKIKSSKAAYYYLYNLIKYKPLKSIKENLDLINLLDDKAFNTLVSSLPIKCKNFNELNLDELSETKIATLIINEIITIDYLNLIKDANLIFSIYIRANDKLEIANKIYDLIKHDEDVKFKYISYLHSMEHILPSDIYNDSKYVYLLRHELNKFSNEAICNYLKNGNEIHSSILKYAIENDITTIENVNLPNVIFRNHENIFKLSYNQTIGLINSNNIYYLASWFPEKRIDMLKLVSDVSSVNIIKWEINWPEDIPYIRKFKYNKIFEEFI